MNNSTYLNLHADQRCETYQRKYNSRLMLCCQPLLYEMKLTVYRGESNSVKKKQRRRQTFYVAQTTLYLNTNLNYFGTIGIVIIPKSCMTRHVEGKKGLFLKINLYSYYVLNKAKPKTKVIFPPVRSSPSDSITSSKFRISVTCGFTFRH